MSITKEQQQALDDALVPREQRLTIGSCNYRLSTTFKPKEPTFQVALDVLTLTPFYPAFLITASVPAVYIQEFWPTVTYQKHHIRFKMNKKRYSFDMETFRNMLLICPKHPGQKFIDPPFEKEILTFIRELGYPGNIKLLSDVKVDTAQILWGLYHQKKVDYVYLLWEDLVFQIENKFTPQHEVVQRCGAVLPEYLTSQAIKESEAYKIYHDLATGKVVKATTKVAKSRKKKQPALGLETLSEVALTEAEQLKLATKRSLIQTHSSHASGFGAHERTSVTPGVPDVPTYEFDDDQISWKSSDEEDDDDEANVGKDEDDHDHDHDDEQTESDNDDEDFVHPKFTTHDDEARQKEVNEEDRFDPRVQTPSHVESTDDEEVQGVNIEGEEMDEEANNEEQEGNELYRDLNVNLEGRDVEMTDDQPTNVQTTQVTEDTHVIITPVIP
ncbi:hypothetical protein Tco_0010955 [Tanacetum coccineum]